MSEQLTAAQQVEKREQYRKWINRAVGFGVVSFVIATAAWTLTEESLVLFSGVGLYWLGAFGMGVGYWYSPVSLRDEFERQMEQDANQAVSAFVAVVTIIGIPADVVLSTTGVYTAPAAVRGAIWGYLLLVFVFGAAHWYVKQQYE
jgi:fatty acid desaturase